MCRSMSSVKWHIQARHCNNINNNIKADGRLQLKWCNYVTSPAVLNHISPNAVIFQILYIMPGVSNGISHCGIICFCAAVESLRISALCNETCRQGLCWHEGPCCHLWVSAKKENRGLRGGGRECKSLLSESQRLYLRLNDQKWIQEWRDTVAAVPLFG